MGQWVCLFAGALVPKDKAIKRYIVRNIVDASSLRDLQEASSIEGGRGGALQLSHVRPFKPGSGASHCPGHTAALSRPSPNIWHPNKSHFFIHH